MEQELNDLSSTLINIYQKNLIFLQESFPEIYKEVDNFSKKLENQEIQEKYSLEYVDGYFDILNHENNGMYYFTNSYEDADKRREFVDFSQSSSLDLLRKIPGSNKLITGVSYKEITPIINFINDNVDMDNVKFEKIYKFIFIGTGLGIHIQEIDKKLKPYTTLIIEPELEIFRLSLFITDYSVFDEGNRKLFLSVGEDKGKRNFVLELFESHHEYMNYNIKYYNIVKSNEYIKDEINEYFSAYTVIGFSYRYLLQNFFRTVSIMKKGEKFLSFYKARERKILNNYKVLIISAGPSLDNYIDWIEKYQNEFLIICVDVIVKKLEKHNIIPQIVISIDPSERCADYLTTENPSFLNKSAIVFHSQQPQEVLDAVKGKHCYFSQFLNVVPELGTFGSSTNVGTYSLQMAVLLGAKSLYLIGNDAAFNQETGMRYANDSSNVAQDNLNIKTDNNAISYTDVIEVKGNLRERVKTTNRLLTFKIEYETKIYLLKREFDCKIYNMSDGAYIDGMEPITYENMQNDVQEFEQIDISILNEFNEISQLANEIDFVDSISLINTIMTKIKKYQKNKFKNKNELLGAKLELTAWIYEQLQDEKYNIFVTIFMKYNELSDIYINFILNIKQKNIFTKESLNKISNIWAVGAITIFKEMKDIIKIK